MNDDGNIQVLVTKDKKVSLLASTLGSICALVIKGFLYALGAMAAFKLVSVIWR